jgi:poly-gamma-glutamate synthesis protein (capsule biosynthesis protein)
VWTFSSARTDGARCARSAPLARSASRSARAARSAVAALLLIVGSPTVLAAQSDSLPSSSTSSFPADGVVTIAFAGDVLLGGSSGEAIDRNGVHWPWERVRDAFSRADYVVVNLETSVARSTTGEAEDKQFVFRADPRTLEGLAAAGVDLVTLANNHTLDYGRAALLETLEHLDAHGVARVGAGANAAEAYRPEIVTFGDLRIGFIGVSRVYPYSSWPATATRAGVASGYDYAINQVLEAVDEIATSVDAVFVLVHWGAELAEAPRQIDLDFADALLRRGVRAVIGHHPHVLQGFEFDQRAGHLVAWSLGNFIFRSFRDETRMSAVLYVDVDPSGRIVGARVEPMFIDDIRPRPAAERAPDVLRRLRALSAPFATALAEDGRLFDPAWEEAQHAARAKIRIPVLKIP